MYSYSEIRSLHLENTSLCNAKCPMCARTEEKGLTNRNLPLGELRLDDIKKIFPPDFIKQLWEVYICGNYGDPVVAKDTLETFAYFKSLNPGIRTKMHTNGSARPQEWWVQLAEVCDEVYFGIDGLKETNPLYRINTNFEKIMQNAEAYIKAGGYAKWQYIVFAHNENQIDEARKMASKMGFKEFNLKKTGRFFSNSKLEVRQEKAVTNSKGEVTHILKMPENPKYLNKALAKEKELILRYGSMVNYLNATQVKCQATDNRSIYVSAEGFVFPCCWLGNQMYVWHKDARTGEIWKLINQLPEKELSISALKHNLKSIIEGPFFQTLIPQSWKCASIQEGKSWVCSKTCGTEFNQFKQQFENQKVSS